MTQLYHLTSMAAWLSSTGICYHSLLSWSVSPQSTALRALGSLHVPQTPAPSCCTFQGALTLAQATYGCGKDCMILIPFRWHRSAASLSALNVSPLTQTIAPCRDQIPASVPPPTRGRSSPTNTPVFLPSSFVLCTSVSEGVFPMYQRGEMYSTSTYSSAILFSLPCFLYLTFYSFLDCSFILEEQHNLW